VIDRRSFVLSASTTLGISALSAKRALGASSNDMLIINSLGSLDNQYGPKPPGPEVVVSADALADAKSSGLTAINMTLSYSDDFEATVKAIASYDDFIRQHSG
jgi:hypothetical protein